MRVLQHELELRLGERPGRAAIVAKPSLEPRRERREKPGGRLQRAMKHAERPHEPKQMAIRVGDCEVLRNDFSEHHQRSRDEDERQRRSHAVHEPPVATSPWAT